MITFKKIRYKNFLSSGNSFTEIDFNTSKTTLIIGVNGAGKSTILDALTFVLFNKPFRKINKPNLINSINNSDCLVEIEFSIGKKQYKIVRGLKPNKFEIWIDNEMLNQESASLDQQKYLEQNILRLNFKSFTQIVILGSSTFVPFMQLPAAQRRDIIEDLLDIKIFSTMNVLLKENIKTLNDEIRSAEYSMEILKQKVDSQEKLIKELKEQSDNSIKQKEDQISDIQTKILEIENSKKLVLEELGISKAMLLDIKNPEEQLKKLETYKSKFISQISKIQKLKTFFEENNSCPTCGQDIDENFKENRIAKDQKQANEVKLALEKLEDKFEEVYKLIENKKQINDTIEELNNQISEKNHEIKALNFSLTNLTNDILNLRKSDTKISDETNSLKEILEQGKNNAIHLKKMKKKKEEYDIISYLLKDSGIKSKIIKKYLPIFNQLINKYLQSMDFYVNFTLDENFDETIKSRYRDEFSYGSFSEGEKMRIDLALLFTWREVAKIKNSINTNLLVLDEVFDSSLDNYGTDDFLRILRGVDSNTNVFVISHKGDILIDKFEKTLSFEKIKNFSKMKVIE